MFDELRFTSQISVPLRARGRTIGGITFTLGPGLRRYDAVDVRLAEDLAQRAAIAVDNARLYRAAQEGEAAAALGQRRARLLADVGAALGELAQLRGDAQDGGVSRRARHGGLVRGRHPRRCTAACSVSPWSTTIPRSSISPTRCRRTIPSRRSRQQGVWQVMRTGQPTLVAGVTDADARRRRPRRGTPSVPARDRPHFVHQRPAGRARPGVRRDHVRLG